MLGIPFQAPGPPPPITPVSPYTPRYDLHDDVDQDHDTGDIPLLRRDPSQGSWQNVNMPMPGNYGDEDDGLDSNIRYGRIPQRVPRRYKTIKRVE